MANKTPLRFAFQKKNYIFMLIGIGLVALGFILMSGGGSADPNVFSDEIFNFRRITLAPLVALLGYGVIGYAIMLKPKSPRADVSSAPVKK